jgi:hypothetical protein
VFIEIADDPGGVPVFLSPSSPTSVGMIPYGTKVGVFCVAPKESGMVGVNAFYLLEYPADYGLYPPANAFSKGGQVGKTGTPEIDRSLPRCSRA